jgi:hypothetical protein
MVAETQHKHPRGHWTRGVGEKYETVHKNDKNDKNNENREIDKKVDNIRAFLDSFAKSHNMDPLVAENWYSITRETFITTEVCF